MWIDVTWGAGGSTADTTLSLCETAMDVTGLDVLMHLTCTNVTVDMTRKVLQRCKEKGLCNILALRGDPPANATEWTATEGGFAHAVDLVRFIRKEFGDYFCIGVAAYPEGHIDAESFDKDLQYYKEKVDAGADFGVTQLFYDTNLYFEFLKKSHAIGVPKSFDVFPGIIRATRTREVLGEKGRRIRELTAVVQKRFGFPENSVELFAERVENRGLSAMAQCESLRFKLLGGLVVRRACYGVVRFVMENGAKGCEVTISGKMGQQRAKVMKFKDGYLISTGQPKDLFVDECSRNVLLRQGVMGIKVKILKPHDPEGKQGPKAPMPDYVVVHDPKEDPVPTN